MFVLGLFVLSVESLTLGSITLDIGVPHYGQQATDVTLEEFQSVRIFTTSDQARPVRGASSGWRHPTACLASPLQAARWRTPVSSPACRPYQVPDSRSSSFTRNVETARNRFIGPAVHRSWVRRAVACSQTLSRSSSNTRPGSAGAVYQTLRASSASSCPGAQPA